MSHVTSQHATEPHWPRAPRTVEEQTADAVAIAESLFPGSASIEERSEIEIRVRVGRFTFLLDGPGMPEALAHNEEELRELPATIANLLTIGN